MNKLVSVVMSVYKEPILWLEKAINSILDQTYQNIEFIIILDNPEYTEAEFLLEEYKKKDSRIIVLKNEKNIGLVESLNRGLKLCSGEYIARMDADDISDFKRIEKQLQYLQSERLDLIGCHSQRFVGEIYEDMRTVYSEAACKMVIRKCPCMVHPSWLGRKKVFDSLQGYRNIEACEDYDFVIRAVERGFKIGNTKEVLFYHRDNPNSISNTKTVRQQLLSRYLSSNYCKKRVVTLEDIDNYLCSAMYWREKKVLEQTADLRNKESGINIKDRIVNTWEKLIYGYTIRNFFEKVFIKCAFIVDRWKN